MSRISDGQPFLLVQRINQLRLVGNDALIIEFCDLVSRIGNFLKGQSVDFLIDQATQKISRHIKLLDGVLRSLQAEKEKLTGQKKLAQDQLRQSEEELAKVKLEYKSSEASKQSYSQVVGRDVAVVTEINRKLDLLDGTYLRLQEQKNKIQQWQDEQKKILAQGSLKYSEKDFLEMLFKRLKEPKAIDAMNQAVTALQAKVKTELLQLQGVVRATPPITDSAIEKLQKDLGLYYSYFSNMTKLNSFIADNPKICTTHGEIVALGEEVAKPLIDRAGLFNFMHLKDRAQGDVRNYTCWLNAALQCILRTPGLKAMVMSKVQPLQPLDKTPDPIEDRIIISNALQGVVKAIGCGPELIRAALENLEEVIATKPLGFRFGAERGAMIDSGEFLNYLFNVYGVANLIETDLNGTKETTSQNLWMVKFEDGKSRLEDLLISSAQEIVESAEQKGTKYHRYLNKIPPVLVIQFDRTGYQKLPKEEAAALAENAERFFTLSSRPLPIQTAQIQSCVNALMQKDAPEAQKTAFTKLLVQMAMPSRYPETRIDLTRVHEAASALIIKGDAYKIATPITMPEGILDRGIFFAEQPKFALLKKQFGDSQFNYRATSFVCQDGNALGGHYLAYGRGMDGQWRCYDDDKKAVIPTQKALQDALSSCYYMVLEYQGGEEDLKAIPPLSPIVAVAGPKA